MLSDGGAGCEGSRGLPDGWLLLAEHIRWSIDVGVLIQHAAEAQDVGAIESGTVGELLAREAVRVDEGGQHISTGAIVLFGDGLQEFCQAHIGLLSKQAQREVAAKGITTLNEQSRAIQDSIAVSKAQTAALREGGAAAAEVARIRKEAEQQARNTGGDVEAIFLERVNKEIAESQRLLAEKLAQQREQVSVQSRVNAEVKAGSLSEQQASELLQRRTTLEAEKARLLALGVKDQGDMNARLQEYERAMVAANNAQREMQALGILSNQRDQIEMLKLEVSLLGRSTEERNRAVAALRAEQQVRKLGVDAKSDIGKSIIDNAKVEADLNSTKDRFVDFGKELSTILGGAFDDLFSNADKGFKGVAENALKSFSRLGTRLIENQILKPLLSGQGFNFGSLTASNDNSLSPSTFFKGIEKAFTDGWKWITGASSGAGATSTVSGAPAASGSSFGGIAAVGVAGLAGFGMGQQSQSPLMGALGGALAGAAAGSAFGLPGMAIGALIGAAGGVLGGIMGQQAAGKQRRQQMIQAAMEYQQNWEQIQPDVMRQRSIWRGETEGSLTGSFREARSSFTNAAKTAQLAGDTNAVFAMERDLGTYLDKMAGEFWRSFGDTLRSLDAGSGPNGPFMQARSQIKQVGEALKGFVTDTQTVGANVLMARKASQDYALSLIVGETRLTAVQTEMERITGTAAGLQDVLTDLGLSSEVAAAAIQQGVVKAMQNLRQSFTNDLQGKLNDALGRGYINDVVDLFVERSTLRADAGRLGLPTDQVEQYFAAAAQQIVDNARLTGDAFTNLVGMFPELNGRVHAFTGALGSLEDRLAAAAQRAQGYEDRLFAATNDNSTLAGALAEFNRRAARERQDEIAAGGEHILLLERTLAAERAKVVKDFNDQIVEQQRASIDSIQRYLDDLRGGSSSTLSPTDRLREAQASYQRELAMARSGNAESANGVTQYAQALLEASRAYYGSAGGYQDAFRSVNTDLMGLQKLFGGSPTLSASEIPTGAMTAPPPMAAADTRIVDGLAALRSENASQRAEIAALRADLARLVAALITAEGDGAEKVKGAVDRLTNETRLAANRPAA